MAKSTTSKTAYPAWLQSWLDNEAKLVTYELLAYNNAEAIVNAHGRAVTILSTERFTLPEDGYTWVNDRGQTYQVTGGQWQLVDKKPPLYVVGGKDLDTALLETLAPQQPTRETCRERIWYMAQDAYGHWYVRKGPVFVIKSKDTDVTAALDALAIVNTDGGFGHPNNRAYLRQIGEDLYAIGEELEPGTGGLKTMRSVYNIAIDAWSPEALVLEVIWRGIGDLVKSG